MTRSYLNSAEIEAMRGLPHEARTLYREGLRPFMDFATGIVGAMRTISYQQLSELLEVIPEPGSHTKHYRPTRSAMRALIARLERAGLLQSQGEQRGKMLFRLLLADADLNRPVEERQGNDKGGTTRQTPVKPDVSPQVNDKGATREERHTSDYPINTSLSVTGKAATYPQPDDDYFEDLNDEVMGWIGEHCPNLNFYEVAIELEKFLLKKPHLKNRLSDFKAWMLDAEAMRSRQAARR